MERINRKDDENLYQPKLHSRRVRELHRLKMTTDKPMTFLLDDAVREYYSWVTGDERLTWEENDEINQLLNEHDERNS